jgi:pimeloyl-ACP methyl ester carboxylesterase
MNQTEMHPRPNIVLVHGAWADGSSWSSVIERLQADGYHVTAAQFPLTSLADDVARLRHVLALQDGPSVIAGHSYGGQVMTALGSDAPNVVGLVYIAAFGIDEGESLGGLLAQGPPAPALMRNGDYAVLKSVAELERTPGVPGLDLPGLDAVSIAKGYGCDAARVTSLVELERDAAGGWSKDVPTVLEVPIAPEVPPLI